MSVRPLVTPERSHLVDLGPHPCGVKVLPSCRHWAGMTSLSDERVERQAESVKAHR
jgi:hypothetical protein